MSKVTGHPGSGTGTCCISERFSQRLDGLYGHSIKVIPLSFFQTSF